MRAIAVLCAAASILFASAQQLRAASRLELSLQQRLDAPQTIASASVTLRDFVGFIGNSFKVPLLVETASPVPDLTIPAGTYSARQLLDIGVRQLRGYEWKNEGGVAHLYQPELVRSQGNLLNVKIHMFFFPKNVADFIWYFRHCIHATTQGYDCVSGGLMIGMKPPGLENEPLPYAEVFEDVAARAILLRALQASGRFYVLIAYESTRPKLASDFPYLNWFTQSLVPPEPAPMWIQRPQRRTTGR
jgi:hypothetical protein